MKANEMDLNYFKSHSWLIYWFGRANKCENINCNYENPKRFEYALKKGFTPEKKRENYIMLCPSCHRKYDFTELQRKNQSKARIGMEAKNKRPVVLNDEIVFESLSEASINTGISISSIHNNIKGLSKTTKLGKWQYQQMN